MDTIDEAAPETGITLAVPLDTVCYIIARAHDLQGKTESSLYEDEEGDPDDLEAEILEDRGGDPVGEELASVISDLSEDAQIDLVTLVWLGRDAQDEETGAAEWAGLRALAEQEHTDTTAAYLCGTPLLADYLAAGLAALGLDCAEWEAENA